MSWLLGITLQVSLLLSLLHVSVISGLWTYRVTWPGGKVTSYTYPRTAHGDCLYDRQRDILTCMRNHGYQSVVNTWLYDPELIVYVSVRCLDPHPYPHRLSPLAPTCVCRDQQHLSSTDSLASGSLPSENFYRCQLQELSPSMLDELDQLEVLDLSHNLLQHLSPQALLPLRALKVMSLASNPLRQLPEGLACPLTSLEVLNLSRMQLAVFPGHAFRCDGNDSVTSSVRWLDVSGNHIEEMPSGSLWYLSTLVFLNISDNLLHHLPHYPLLGAPSLISLSLAHNLLYDVPRGFCEGAARLQRLSLEGNVFTSLGLSALDTCQNLTSLDLRGNILNSLPGPPASLPNLEHLYLSHNRLTSLTSPLIAENCSLVSLDLSHNELRQIRSFAFGAMTSLAVLDLSNNALSESTMDLTHAFLNQTKLQKLNLSRNQFTSVTNDHFKGLTSLLTLDLSQNNIESLSFAMDTALTRLTHLNVSSNQLTSLPAQVLSPLISLRVLDLSDNSLHLVQTLLVPGSLLSLDFSDNSLKTVPSLPRANHLQQLDLSFNSISQVREGDLQGLSGLTQLNLAHNSISNLHVKSLGPAQRLRSLHLAHNRLTLNGSVSALLYAGFSSLLTLNLSHNRLTDVKVLFQSDSLASVVNLDVSYNAMGRLSQRLSQMNRTMHLEHLHLEGCRLREISAQTFTGLIYLRSVNLQDNKLTHLPLFHTHPGVKYRLRGNPITCDCYMGWLKHDVVHVQGQTVSTHDYDVSLCRTLPRGHLLPVRDVSAHDFLCIVSSSLCPSGCVCYSHKEAGGPEVVFCTGGMTTIPALIPPTTRVLSVEGGWLGEVLGFGEVNQSWPFIIEELYLNNSGITALAPEAFHRLPLLSRLQLDHNQLSLLHSQLFDQLFNVTSLYLSDNRLVELPAGLLTNVERLALLDVSDNFLKVLSPENVQELMDLEFLEAIKLSGNPWTCDCENAELYKWVSTNVSKVADFDAMHCENDRNRWFIEEEESSFDCSDGGGLSPSLAALIFVGLPVMVVVVVVAYKFRRVVAAVLYSRLGMQCLKPHGHDTPLGHLYDVSILYDHSDRKCRWWVEQILLSRLTSPAWRLRVHVPRSAGQAVSTSGSVVDSAVYSVRQSAVCVVLVSKHFGTHQHTVTCLAQVLQQAQLRPSSLVLITWGELTKQTLECGIRPFLGKRQHLPITVPFFWDRLLYLLPSAHPSQAARRHSLISACRFRSLSDVSTPSDDKIERQDLEITQHV